MLRTEAGNIQSQRSPLSNDGNPKRITQKDIGRPFDFRHVSHVGWDPNRGLNFEKVEDPQLKKFFDMAGVTESHLQDSEAKEFINDFLSRHGGIEEDVQSTTPPPPVKAPTAHGPPPPAPDIPRGTRAISAPHPPLPSDGHAEYRSRPASLPSTETGRLRFQRPPLLIKDGYQKRITQEDIGWPFDFRHVSHVGWNPNRGFSFDKVEDPQLKKFFDMAGVTESHLQDRKTREFIYDFLSQHRGVDRFKEDVQSTPPPPSQVTSLVAPPGVQGPSPPAHNRVTRPRRSRMASAPPPRPLQSSFSSTTPLRDNEEALTSPPSNRTMGIV